MSITRDATNNISIYINGQLAGSGSTNRNLNSFNAKLYVGKSPFVDQAIFKGRITNIGFWKKALSQGELTQVASSGPGSVPTQLTECWNLTDPQNSQEVNGLSKGISFVLGHSRQVEAFDPTALLTEELSCSGNQRKASTSGRAEQKWAQHTSFPRTENPIESESIMVYPNPTTDFIMIKDASNRDERTNMKIYNASGALMLNQQANNTEKIDVSQFPQGMYYLEFSSGDRVLDSERLIIL